MSEKIGNLWAVEGFCREYEELVRKYGVRIAFTESGDEIVTGAPAGDRE